MFKEIKSRRLALLVAIALGGGGFLSSAQNVSAADVTGNNVTIDDTQAPSNNAKHPGGGAAFGTAAGFIKDEHDNGNVKDNTLTFKNLFYDKQLYGGLTFGTGNVTGNKVFVNPATSPHDSSSDGIFGGSANGGGNVEDNHATFNGNHLNGDLVGGMATDGGTGTVKKNTATLKGGNVHGSIYGGTTGNQANGDVLKNEVLIEGGTVTGTGNVYGGYSDGDGNVKGNIVTIKGGVLNGIYGGYSSGTGEVSGNTVNLGDGTSAMAAGYAINGTIYGGRNDSHPDKVLNNTLNVNTNATAYNIKNFSTINFNFNAYTNTTQSLLTLNDSHGTTIGSLNDLKLKDAPRGSGTLIENASGLTLNSYSGALKLTAEKTETIIDKQGTTKIGYNAYQFRDSTETRSEGLEVWGGRSTIGNTTTKNIVTLNGNYTGRNAYGGRTDGTGSTATGENAKNHSIENTITLDGAGSIVNNMTGGMTLSAGGNATGNRAVLKAGTVNGSLTGGSVGSSGGDVTGNFVDVNGGTVHGTTYGGYASGTGKAEHNTVTLTGGTLNSDIYGGVASSGAAMNNTVNIKGGSAANHDVYGGFSTNGNATGNTVNITGGSVRNVDGGRSINGHATNNIVNIGSTDAAFAGSITGIINGGSGTTYGNDYRTGNKLNVYGNATATNIKNFAELNFHFNAHVTQTTPFLTLSDAGGTTIQSLGDINVDGEHGRKGTLLKNTHGVTITDAQHRLVKTTGNKELVLAKSSDNKSIDYEGYAFAHQTAPTTVTEGGTTSTWGGRSIAGNSTHDNAIAVESGTHTNVYGGWTSGTGSDAPADKQKNSTLNKIKVSGAANVTGKVYGGFTDVAGGNATGNEVTIEKSITGDVVGGKAFGDASGNIVTVKANTGAVTGGDGATTNNNTVNLEGGVTVNGALTGGTQANSADNTLNVKGQNSAQSVEGFQKMNFNTNGVAAGGTMLNVTGGAQTKVNWNTLTVDGNGRDISLLKNNNGIDFGGTYTDGAVKSGLSADQKSEMNVSVTAGKTEIKYTGYQFTGVTTASVDGTKAYGGISKAGNATHHNNITVNGNYDEVYGGHTTGTSNMGVEQKNSHDNTVTITGGMLGKVYGGYTDAADGTTENNTVNLGDGTNALAAGTNLSNAELYGGNKSAKGNTLNVNTAATVGKIENFSTVAFKNASSKLTLTQAGANFDLDTIKADFAATENEDTLVENANGLTLKDNKTFRTALSADGTKETNIEARNGNKEIVRYGYTFKGATTVTTRGTEMWGGRSAAGNSTYDNKFTVNDNSGKTVYGGYTSGANGTATDKNDSHTNEVTLTGGTYTNVYGGWTNVTGGKAVSNTVNVNANASGNIVGGYSASSEASNNVVDVTNSVLTGNITGGQGSVTNYNVIRLRNASVSGTITGGTAANGVDNTLDVSYGTSTSSSVGDITNIQRLHFDMENAPVRNANPLLKLTNVSGGDKNLTGMKFAVARSGATKKLAKGDTFTLMENMTTGGHNITVGNGVTAEGRDGVSRKYEFAVHQDPNNAHKLVATVTKVSFAEQAKSLVETRAGASAFLNDGADFLAGAGMNAAQKEARAAAMTGSAPYGIWAGMGAGSLRHKTGSYVDMKGWNLGVGWARENAVKEGTLTFGPFIEYGRGSYDSYLDDGTHGNGKTSYLGAGVMAKLETKANNWIDGSLRVGRTKSDYTGLDTSYDTTSTYYAMHVGVGKDFHVREGDTVSAYVRYSYAHTAGTSAHLSSGETYDFDAVNSHRLRIGTRYTHGETALSQLYAGLAWEYEFDGDARATYDGDSAPSPSLKGGSALLELGYRFAPQGSRLSYDLNLNGWQGKRQGVTGGISVKWAF